MKGFGIRLMAALTALCIILALSAAALAADQVVTTGSVHLRTGPGLLYKEADAVPAGTWLTYLNGMVTDDRGVDWYRVSYNGKSGWVSSMYASLGGVYKGSVEIVGNINVRSGPGLAYAGIGTLTKGRLANYLGSTATDDRGVDWYKISCDGLVGWVSSAYAKLSADGASTGGSDLIAIASVNLRTGPGVAYPLYDAIPKGAHMTYLETAMADSEGVDWYQVSYKGKEGWVCSKYVGHDDGSWGSIRFTGNANLRSGPSLAAALLDVVPMGSVAPYLGSTATDDRGVDWYKVSYNGKAGWVSSMYAGFGGGWASSGGSTGSSSGSSSGSWGGGYSGGDLIATGNVDLRKDPNLKGEIITSIPAGDSMTYVHTIDTDERGVEWYQVEYKGMDGWVSSQLVKFKD